MMGDDIEVPVVIVGGGPIGLTLSYILGKNDIEHVLLEQNETTSKWPKATIVNTRSMELYRRLGLDTTLSENGLPGGLEITLCTSLINNQPMLAIPLSQLTGKSPHKQKDGTITYEEQWTTEKTCKLSQIFLEPIIKAETSKYESSDIKFGWQVQSVSQTQENVRVEAVNVKSGEKKVYQARYVVGCDGGKSIVRKSMGIHFKGDFNLEHFRSISFRSTELRKRLVSGDCLGELVVKPTFMALMFLLEGQGHFVAHFFLAQNQQIDKNVNNDELIKTLMDNEDIPYTIVFENEWQGHFAVAETLQDGRIFLAGDSCHVVIPVGGFGMNTGIVDAYDIGWKLVATIKGWGGERLLASYTAERLHGINKLVSRIQQIYDSISRYRGFVRVLGFFASTFPFKYIMRVFMDPMSMQAGVSGVLFGIRLDTSSLCIPSSLPVPPEDPLNYTPIAHPGCRAPHFQFEDGTTLYDRLGSAFTLLQLQPSTQNVEPILAAATHCAIPLKVVSFNDPELKKLYRGMDLVIIRPDLYIAWCGNEIPTLLHNEDINEGARVLMKVITGGEVLPAEWRQKQKNRNRMRTVLWIPVVISVIVGISAASFGLLQQYKSIN